jgi:hypothetical protein
MYRCKCGHQQERHNEVMPHKCEVSGCDCVKFTGYKAGGHKWLSLDDSNISVIDHLAFNHDITDKFRICDARIGGCGIMISVKSDFWEAVRDSECHGKEK